MSNQISNSTTCQVPGEQCPVIEVRSAKPFPDESNREAIEEMLWHAVQFCQEQAALGLGPFAQAPVIKVEGGRMKAEG